MTRTLASFLALAIAVGLPGRAVADIDIVERGGWRLWTDGRLNSFITHARGTAVPPAIPDYTGIDDEPTADNRIASTRLRTGYIASLLAVNLRRQVSEKVTVTGRIGLWLLAASTRSKADLPPIDTRELYIRVDGPLGGLLAGRNMSLFPRGAIMINYDYGHAFGLGHPCATQVVSGGACGHAGHGTSFPGFNSGMVYNTPELRGFQLSVGVFDPSTIPVGRYERTPYPRFEGEATFRLGVFHAFAHGFTQRLSRTTTDVDEAGMSIQVDHDVSARGLGAGLAIAAGPLRLGGSAYQGEGIGVYLPVENNPVVVDEKGKLRVSEGVYGQSALVLASTRLAVGVGVTRIYTTDNDPLADEAPAGGNPKLIKQQLGISVGLYRTVGPLVLALEYFRGEYLWHDYGELSADGTELVIKRPRQAVDFVNAGISLLW